MVAAARVAELEQLHAEAEAARAAAERRVAELVSGGPSKPPPSRAAADGSQSPPSAAPEVTRLRADLEELRRRGSRERAAQQAAHAGRCAGLLQEVRRSAEMCLLCKQLG